MQPPRSVQVSVDAVLTALIDGADDGEGAKRAMEAPMRAIRGVLIFMLVSLGLVACSSAPPARLGAYLGQDVEKAERFFSSLPEERVQAGLLVINDTTGPRSAPPISPQGMAYLTDRLAHELQKELRLDIVPMTSQGEVPPTGDIEAFLRLGKEQGYEYLLLAIVSSQESEVPEYLPLTGTVEQGGTRPLVPGFYAQNYALVELALLDIRAADVVVKADGRAWASLNRLYTPVRSTGYPVVHRALQIAPIFPTEANAKDVLRSVAADDAIQQAVMHLRQTWGKMAEAARS